MRDRRFLALLLIVFLAVVFRALPHPPNFSPIAALALFSGAYLSRHSAAFLIPFTALFISDLFVGFHATAPAVYLSFGLVYVLGLWLRGQSSVGRVAFTSVTGSVIFFVITNFAVWVSSGMYEHSLRGLAACYAMALPFLQNSVAGDLFYSGLLFGVWAFAQVTVPSFREDVGQNG